MFWYKTWRETEWRFVAGVLLLAGAACEVVLFYPRVLQLIPLAPPDGASGPLAGRIRESIDLARSYGGYIWSQAFRANLANLVTLFAVLLGTGGLAPGGSGGGLYSLSLPASRRRIVATRAAVGLAELLVVALLPAVLIPLLSPAVGQHYSPVTALVHGTLLFLGGAVFFSLAVLLSSELGDFWPPMLISLFAAIALAFAEQHIPGGSQLGIFSAMRGEAYFRTGALPWGGLALSAALSALFLYGSALIFERRDF